MNMHDKGRNMKIYSGKRTRNISIVTVNNGRITTLLKPFFPSEHKLGHEFSWGCESFQTTNLAMSVFADLWGYNNNEFIRKSKETIIVHFLECLSLSP